MRVIDTQLAVAVFQRSLRIVCVIIQPHRAGQYRAGQVQAALNRNAVARDDALPHGGFQPCRAALRPIVRNRGFQRGCWDELFIQRRDVQAAFAHLGFFGQRADTVIFRTVSNLRFQQPSFGFRAETIGVFQPFKIALQGGLRYHFYHSAGKFAFFVFKHADFVRETFHAEKFVDIAAVFRFAQGETLADNGQGRIVALICLHHTAAFALQAKQGHTAFNSRYGIAFHAFHRACTFLSVKIGRDGQYGHIPRSRRLGNNQVCAVQNRCIAAQHAAVNQPRVQCAHHVVSGRNRREQFVFCAGQFVFRHRAAAVGRVGQPLAGQEFQILARELGRLLCHIVPFAA